MQPNNSSLTKISQLETLVDIDKADHKLKDIAELFVNAARDWDTFNQTEISDFVKELKQYFGSPLTKEKITNKQLDNAWRHEAGSSIFQVIDLSERFYNQPDFDEILNKILTYYEQQMQSIDPRHGSCPTNQIIPIKLLYLRMNVPEIRKSHLEIGKLYFWTATINNWHKLLDTDALKNIIISSLEYLVDNKKVEVYAFVIMPNHIHLVWQMMEMNNKEMPHTSFLKYTAHAFKRHLQLNNPGLLSKYAVEAKNKSYEFWQRDSLAFELLKKQTIKQKIEYIHYNPTMQRWQLCVEPADYYYSSAAFYEKGDTRFKFLKHIVEAL